MRRLILAALTMLVSGACSLAGPSIASPTTAPAPTPRPGDTPTATPAAAATAPPAGAATAVPTPATLLSIYLPRMHSDGRVTLVRLPRSVGPGPVTAQRAVAAFLAGPSGEERARDVGIALRRATAVRGVEARDGTATVDFGAAVQEVSGTPWVAAVYWGLVLTLLDVPGVQHVALLVEGQPLQRLGTPPYPVPQDPRREQAPFQIDSWPDHRA